jgi:predicted metallopeptidase
MIAVPFMVSTFDATAQKRTKSGSHPRATREILSNEDRAVVEQAISVVCSERQQDPQGSVAIDDMQKRPSLSLRAPEVISGAARAQRLLPNAKALVIASMRELSAAYRVDGLKNHNLRMRRAIARIQAVARVKPDIDARDNASVYLRSPHTITFGTIFLAGLPSDEGMVSVLAHELVHIADGDADGLRPLFHAVGERASNLTGLHIREQRAEELTCDLLGELSVQAFIAASPKYDPLPRRLARAVEHNCVDEDDSDDEHLSPRNTLRALLTIDRALRRQLVYGR